MRGHLYRPITDNLGNVVPNTIVTLFEVDNVTLLGQTIWSDPVSTSTPRMNPWTTSDGFIDIYLDVPQTLSIGLQTPGSPQTIIRNITVLPAPEALVLADEGFEVIGTQTAGYFLQAGVPGQAAWTLADDIINGKPTALEQLVSYDWSGSSLSNTVLSSGSPSYIDVTADSKPGGYTFTKALGIPAGAKLSVPAYTWPEPGQVIYLYKVVSANAGVGAATLTASVDGTLSTTTPTAPDLCNTWQVGFVDSVPGGSHLVTFAQSAGSDSSSYVLLGPVVLQFGNNIPAHDHSGTAADSTLLGTGAVAGVGGTAVGASANASGADATAFGHLATASAGGTAVGQGASAGTNAVAVGIGAGGSTNHTGWVAVGSAAVVGADDAIAIGAGAGAQGSGAIAIGPAAVTGAVADAIAIGAGASAQGISSVALGAGATVGAGHDYSMAIGQGAATTGAHQAVLGDTSTTVVVPGNFAQTGGQATLAGSGGTLGFFGSAGVTKPVVTGSRGGNAVLTSLLSLLSSMGLITDNSTS